MCDQAICEREDHDWVIGWNNHDNYDNPWFLVREGGGELSNHATHNEAMREAQATDKYVQMFHEGNGGGCLGSFDESPYDESDECY